ncbi:MAG: hypothetical protein HC765_15815, partial [Brachymonas sp.]|nr:hypothetical protein [Brachymonas sp.]
GVNTLSIATSGALAALPTSNFTAGTLALTAANGIGSSSAALQTNSSNIALTNTGSGGIYLTNSGDFTVAAKSTNGDVVIRGSNGATAGAAGSSITVGMVNGLNGITTTGNAGVQLTAGNGTAGAAGADGTAQNGNAGGAGGSLNLGLIQTDGALNLRAGDGGVAGRGGMGRTGRML